MKRLLRKSSIDYNGFLKDIFHEMIYYKDDEIDEVIQKNNDCLYNGVAYRVLFFNSKKVLNLKNDFVLQNNNYSDEEIIDYIASNLIKVNGYYQPFTKSLEGLNFAYNNLNNGKDIPIFIQYNVSNSLDMGALCDKLNRTNPDINMLKYYEEYRREEEVIAKFDTSDFEIVNRDELLNLIQNF